jgi:hypothetical protein
VRNFILERGKIICLKKRRTPKVGDYPLELLPPQSDFQGKKFWRRHLNPYKKVQIRKNVRYSVKTLRKLEIGVDFPNPKT